MDNKAGPTRAVPRHGVMRAAAVPAVQRGKQVRIVALANLLGGTNNGFSCKDLDGAGDAIGSEFDVYAFSRPVVSGEYGQQDLEDCDPSYIAGEDLWVEWRSMWFGDTAGWVSGWFAADSFITFGCEA